jgi:hypothetical protein
MKVLYVFYCDPPRLNVHCPYMGYFPEILLYDCIFPDSVSFVSFGTNFGFFMFIVNFFFQIYDFKISASFHPREVDMFGKFHFGKYHFVHFLHFGQ